MTLVLNRQSPPLLSDIEKLTIPAAFKFELDNGIPLYTINAGKKEIIKLELIFKAGKWYETGKLVSKFAAKLMKQGTSSKSSKDIAESFDFYGANFKVTSNAELGTVTVYTLKKHLYKILPLVCEILSDASFPEYEFDIFKNKSRQNLLINLEKNEFLASRKFLNVLYGDDHPFGYNIELEDYDEISLKDVKAFYQKYYNAGNCSIIASGIADDDVVNEINKTIGRALTVNSEGIKEPAFNEHSNPNKIHFSEKEHSVQAAIRIGMHLINKRHPDYPKLSVVNTILGGYFGSRLMSNIREEKGYTYGIYSGLNSLLHSGHFMISTEVGSKLRNDTINEISAEILRLQTEVVPDDELATVKNYMIAQVLRSLDGPFNLSKTYKKLWIYGLDENYLHNLIHEIHSIDQKEIMKLATQYFNLKEMYQIAVG